MKSKSLLTLLCGLFFFIAKSQVAPVFTGGTTQTLAVCQNSGTNVIDTKMVTTDPDAGQTLTYTIASAPIHGTVHGFPGLTSTGAGGIISPSGFDYAPANGYSGLDSFTVNVNDGSFSAQTKIIVTVNALPTVAAISGTASACIGLTSQLANATTGGVWSSSNVFVADISNTGLVTAQAAGTATISYTVTNGTTGCSNAATVTFQVAGPPVVQAITGTTTVCAGSTTQLSSATTGGVWTSNNTTRATVNSSTGLVTGVNGGAVTITYTVTNGVGCSNFVTASLTVNNRPNVSAIGASTTTICVGSTTTLTNATNGGTWNSSNTSVATVVAGGGGAVVTGVSTGVATISYTVTNANGCVSSVTVDITIATSPTVPAITGPTAVCVGNTIQLSNTTSGGVWTTNAGGFFATVSANGLVTGVNAGNAVITYTVTGASGCPKAVTYNVTVSNVPNVGTIIGNNQICIGTTTTLSNSTGGGVWASTNTSIATINSSGLVTGISAGVDTISYTVTNGAGCTRKVIFALTVSSAITVAAIQGGSSVCLGSTLTLTNATTGGVWNSSDLTVATVVNGIVYPISQGVVAITYTVGTGACSGVATKNVIVNPSPTVGAISGTTAICVGTTSQLSNATSGGTWTSSNTTFASVSGTGLVTPGNFAGSATITYTVTNIYGCTAFSSINVTINNRPNVNAITGINSTCVGSTTQLACTTTGGTWVSSNTNLAIVTATGLVIGLAPGTDTISYSVTNGNGCTTTSIREVTISAALTVAPIVGTSVLCIGATPQVAYTCTTSGGAWSSSNSAVVAINATTGLPNPATAGNATISYTVNNGGSCTATSTLAVNVAIRPNVPTVSGATSVCVDASITLTGNPTGGKWGLQNIAFANFLSIDSTTGVATGISNFNNVGILYTVTNTAGCSRSSNPYSVSVTAGPTISNITPNNPTVCVGASVTLSNSTPNGEWSSSNKAIVTIDSLSGIATGVANGNANIFYTVTNVSGCASVARTFAIVNTTPTVATTTGLTSVCVGSSTTLYNGTANGTWTSSNTTIATVSNTGAVTGRSAGTCNIIYTVTSGGVGGCSANSVTAFTVNAVPSVSPITAPPGVSGVCVGSTLQLSNATNGGTWSISNTRATISSTGLVTGVLAGSIIASYTVTGNGCSSTAFANGTVYALPNLAVINGSTDVCIGSSITLTNDSAGGTWNTDNAAIATVDASGVVTGVAAGTVNINYSKINSNGCIKTVTKAVTVNALPTIAAITGNSPICVGATNTLSNATATGTWFSANAAIATITSGGVVTGFSAGVATIRYIVTNASGCKDSVSVTVTVNTLPLVATIGGSNAVCVGSTTALTNSTGTGVWSSSNTSVATITVGGIVSGLTIGTTTIKYQVTNASGCVDSSTTTVAVNALPIVAAITGNAPVCVGSTRALASATTGGVWTSNNSAIATVNANGNVLGVSAGTATIKYQVTNASGCIDSATTIITVNALPSVAALTGTNTVCVGLTTTYSSTTGGGVWSSSNTAVASVAGGVVTGVIAGSATISYAVTNANGCITTVTRGVTVNALPTVAAISGASAVCVNSSITLTNATGGGVWTSSDLSVATLVGSTVTGVSAGTVTITYTVSNANGCINTATKSITVNALPAAVAAITGTTEVCVSSTTTLSTTSTGGLWSSSNTAKATVDASGVVTGVAAGISTISYTITNAAGCVSSNAITVAVKAKSISTTALSICPSDLPFTWNSLTFNAAGSQTAHLTNAAGCDSAATLNLTVKANTTSITNISICPSDLPFVWNGLTFNAAGSQTAYLTNVVGCDSAATLNLTVKANTTSTTNTSICPSALPFVWNGLTFNAAGTQTAHLTNAAGCDSAATLNLTVKTNTTSTTNQTACNSFTWNGTTYTTSGVYTFTTTNAAGCDSVATLNLTINLSSTSTTNTSICPSDLPFVWNGLTFSAAGSQTAHLINAVACDSAATLNLTIKANSTSTTNTSICPSDLPFTWNGLTFNTAGSQTAHLTNAVGCDSAATLNLTVKANTTSTTNTSICPSALPFVWNGLTFNAAGTQTAHLTNAAGCDSAATLNLTVKANTTSTTIHTACNTYTWNAVTYNTSGVYTFATTNAAGCDSVATLNLTINYASTSTTSATACNSFAWNGTTYTTSGVYTFTTPNAVGCDSVATLNLTVNYASISTTNQTACNSFTWNGTTYTTSGVYTFTTPNAVGCDSVATLNLTVNYASTSTTNQTACNSFTWNGTTYTTSGVYTFTTTNAKGCDSVATLNLTVNYSSTSTTNQTACNSFTWNGTTYTSSGVYTFTTPNAVGCDSVATLNLTVNYASTSTTNQTACNSFTWNGTTYTTSGVYTFTTPNAVGCDSVATLNLTVHYSSTSTSNQTACNSFTWNGTTYTTSGVYTFTTPNAVGCDSVATLNLAVNYASTSTTNQTACNSFTWNGTTYTTSGVYTFTTPNAVGCDSVATLNLVVNYASTSTTNKTICASELPYSWNGLTFNAAGSQTAHFTNAAGCDSAATLNLIVKANPIVPAINGTKSVCVNGTTPLSNTATAGVWSSSNTSAATVDNSGVVSGIAAGISTISYTVTNANNCSATATTVVTVNALPTVDTITGSHQVCVTSTKVLGNATLGGVWSSLTPFVATVTNAGVVGGVSVGGTTIKYTVTDANGCSNSANHILTVNALPTVTPITGTNTVCVGAITSLSSTTIGGAWSSNNTAIASVDVSGVVTGVASGVTVINYTVNNVTTGCLSTASTSVTVNALPVLGGINGSSSLCVNSTATLSNTTTGGTWSSSDAAVATIDNAGVLTAVAAGTTTIKYIVSNGSGCVDSVSKTITVNDNPVVTAITAAPTVCAGSNITASNITPNGVWSIGNTAVATIDASGLVNAIAAGSTTIIYTVIDAVTTCSSTIANPLTVNTPAVAPITGVNALCPLSTSTLATTTTGGVWSSTDPSVATVDVNTGLVTAIANGVATITYKVPVGNACGDSASTLVTVNTTLAIAPITGDSTVCNGSSSTLASLTLGGVWSSSDPSIATIDATTGIVSTLNPGTSTITYSVTSGAGCSSSLTTTFTVDSLPAPVSFTAPTSICKGATVLLIPSVTGGVWNSSPNNIVFVDNAGNANGVAAGIAMVSYHTTNASGCSSDTLIKAITVVDLPTIAAIGGSNTVCLGSTTTLTNDSTGGVWNSSNTSVLTIDVSGIVTPVAAGTTTVNYTITNAASCAATVSKSITVFDTPTVDPIVGGNSVCVGSTITLASPTGNGVWSSVTPFIASVNNAGVLTGNFSGGTTIKYTVTDAVTTCSNFAGLVVTVNALPTVPAIAGANSVCLNNSTTLSNTTTGGTWSSNNASVATIDNAGLVNGVGAGTATITYIVTNASGCSTAVTTDVTVNVATSSSTTQTSCDSYLWNGTTYATSGTYTFATTNAAGCDSVATLILTINHSTSSNTSQTACNSFTWNGTTYTTSGQYYFASTNASGCSNIDTLNLTVNYSTSSNTSQTACNSFTWNGTTYTTSGQYYFASTNASGCSNIDTLNLTVNYSTSSNTSQTACNSFTWNGTTYTTSGQYYFASTNASGCSNIDTLNLIINHSTSSNTSQTACDSFTWNGTTYTTSGQYYFASTNTGGCTNTDTLNLTINITPASPSITTSTLNVTIPATAVAYSCSTVANATSYTWSYTGTGVTIASGQGTTDITADFAANATNGDIQVVASNGTCSSAPTTASIILPTTLSSFTATKVNKTALVKWTTATEINSKNFEIQRSIDGRNFVTVGTIAAKGFASDYNFTDEKPFAGVNYYRLKQVDNDGKYTLSIVKTVKFDADGKFVVNIYPNPATDVLNVRLVNGEAKQVRILNTLGKVVYSTNVIAGGTTTQLPIKKLSAGTYFVEVISNENRVVEKFIKN